jgi:hypothetical protein
MKNPFKATPEEEAPSPLLKGRPSISKLAPPPTNDDKLREALKILNHLECEYEITIHNMQFIRKNLQS